MRDRYIQSLLGPSTVELFAERTMLGVVCGRGAQFRLKLCFGAESDIKVDIVLTRQVRMPRGEIISATRWVWSSEMVRSWRYISRLIALGERTNTTTFIQVELGTTPIVPVHQTRPTTSDSNSITHHDEDYRSSCSRRIGRDHARSYGRRVRQESIQRPHWRRERHDHL